MSGIEGETVKFECEVLDDNQSALWFKDGTEVCTSDKYITESHGKCHRLVVSNTQISDSGEYSVKIRNCIRHTRLNVQEYFTHNMKRTIECVEGDNVKLSCAVLEDNVPAVWMKKGVVVQQSAKYKINDVGMMHKMSIIGADRQDSGEYTVTINNRIRSSSLLVKEIPAAIHQLSEKDKDLYLEIIKAGTETRYYIRIVIIGENGVGKTCLLRRLLGETIDDVESTDGIDIVHKCKIRLSDGHWVIDGGSDKRKAILYRIKRAVNSKSSKDNIQEKLYSENDPAKISRNANVQGELHYQIGKPKISEDVHIQEKLTIQSGTLVAAGSSYHEPTTHKESRKTSIGNKTGVIGSTSGHESNGVTEAHLSHVVAIKSRDQLSQSDPLQVNITRNVKKLEQLLTAPVLNELSEFLNDIGKFDIPEEVLVDVGFWDFAGQRHYYATHPIFLNSNAVHLLVANIMKDIKQIDTEDGFDKIGEYVDFWFDSVHSGRDIESKTENSEDKLDPPVIVVCTGIDSCKDNLEERKKEFRQQLLLLLDNEDKMNHLRRICWVSNTKPSDTDFDHLRQSIFEFGKTMKIFGEKLPLKWIQLERLLDIIREAGVNILSWPDMIDLSFKCSINEEKEITLFLKYQHKIGSIIYFESLKENIIINPKWLADAFRCLVTDKFDSDITITSEWKMLEDTGKLEPVLIEQLFQKDPHLEFFKHQPHLLNVMELFGIIVKVTTLLEDGQTQRSSTYYMPCMISKHTSIMEITRVFHVEEENCKRTPWLCMEFTFMPLDFFNHFLCYYIRKYHICTEPTNKRVAIYHGIGIFYLDRTKLRKFIVCFSKNTIAIQLWQWKKIEQSEYKEMMEELKSVILRLKDKYEPRKLSYILKLKCSEGNIHNPDGRVTYKELVELGNEEYFCEDHRSCHNTNDCFHTWFADYIEGGNVGHKKDNEDFELISRKVKDDDNTDQERSVIVASITPSHPISTIQKSPDDVEIIYTREQSKKIKHGIQDTRFIPKCDECGKEPSASWCHSCQRSMCHDCNSLHRKSDVTSHHIVQHVQDMYTLDYNFKVYKLDICDIKVLHDDVLIIADGDGNQLVTCLITGQQKHIIPLPGYPFCIAVVDNNTVAVTLDTDTVVIVDLRRKQVIQHNELKLGCYGIMYRDSQLYVGCADKTIKVLNMSGEVTRTLPVDVIFTYICGGEAGHIYYTGYDKLCCMDTLGNILFTFTDSNMSEPWEITTDDESNVLVISHNSICINVLRVSPDGRHSKVIITQMPQSDDGLRYPFISL